MSGFYSRMQGTASRLLAKYAQGVVVLSRAGTPTGAANEWDLPTDADPTTWTLDATVKGVSAKYVNGDTVKATDLEIMAAVFADAPQLSDNLTIDGKPVTILQVMREPAAGDVVVWTILARA
jgi:hypothetical protein